jgi:DNA-binding MarR family transcriptional regulator
MPYKDIGELTLITKGTLTGVINRLEQKGLVKKVPSPQDGRSTHVLLTAKGNSVFQKEYPRQIASLKQRFDRLSKEDLRNAEQILLKIRDIFI